MPLHGLGVPPIGSDYEPLPVDDDLDELIAFRNACDCDPDDGGPLLEDLR